MARDEVACRLAVVADAPRLAAFGSQSFVDAYGSSNSERDVAEHLARTYSPDLQRAELEDSRSWTILADRGGEIVGAVLVQWKDPPRPVRPDRKWAEIKRFYVGRPHWRTGVSGALMQEVLGSIRARRGTSVWLQVWEHAAQAIGFYRKWGFGESGRTPFLLGAAEQCDLLMARDLAIE